MTAKEFQGKAFLQIAPRLRWTAGPHRLTVESFRPMNEKTGQIVGDPPVIQFDADANVDVQNWLDRGRIAQADAKAKPAPPLTDTEAHKVGAALTAEGTG